MALKSVFELGVAEAYGLLASCFQIRDLPPLDAIENEDWGRDYLLDRLQQVPAQALAEAGLTWEESPVTGSSAES